VRATKNRGLATSGEAKNKQRPPTDVFSPNAQKSQIPRARLIHLTRKIHGLGERPLFELLAELDRGAPLAERLEAYAALPADFIRTIGADALPTPARLVDATGPPGQSPPRR